MMAEYKPLAEIRLNAAVRVINSCCELRREERKAKKRYNRLQRKKTRAAWWRENKGFVFEYALIFSCIALALAVVNFFDLYQGAPK